MKIDQLGNLAALMTGLQLRPGAQGDTYYLQANHFDVDGQFDSRVRPSVQLESIQTKHLLQPGDVLYVCKGHQRFATRYLESMGRAVASPIFAVIRLQSHREITPQYLTWFLNHPRTRARTLTFVRAGTTVPSLTLQDVAEIEISFPDLARQNAILQVDALRRREAALRHNLDALRDALVQKRLYQSIR